jgi:hypothetical protein
MPDHLKSNILNYLIGNKYDRGTYTYPDLKIYVGEFKDGTLHGHGTSVTHKELLKVIRYFSNGTPNRVVRSGETLLYRWASICFLISELSAL